MSASKLTIVLIRNSNSYLPPLKSIRCPHFSIVIPNLGHCTPHIEYYKGTALQFPTLSMIVTVIVNFYRLANGFVVQTRVKKAIQSFKCCFHY